MGFSPQSARSTAYGSGRHTGHHYQPASQLSSFLRKKLFRVSKQNTRPPPSPTSLPHDLEPPVPPVLQAGTTLVTRPTSPKSPPMRRCSKGKMLLTKHQSRRDPEIVPLIPPPQTKPQHTTTTLLSKEDHVNPGAQTVQQEGCTSHLLQELPDGGNETQREEPRDVHVHLKVQRQQEGGGRGGEKEAVKGGTKKHSSKTTVATLASEQEEKVREFKESVRFYKHQLECGYRHHILTLDQMKSATEVLPEEQRGKAFHRYAEAYAEVLSEHLRARRTPATLEQYEFIQTLGHGGFGAVYLVRRRTDGQYFALKQVPKRKVLKASSRERQLAERNFLSVSRCPSVVQLHATFQDELFLYQVGEFLQGGSLMHYMHAKQKFPEDVVKVCIAELVLAVKEVHDRGYIHRDIKPDNIVFTRDGHLKLLDFGLAKFAPLVFQHASQENMKCASQQCCSHVKGQAEKGGASTTTSSTAASPNPVDTGIAPASSPEGARRMSSSTPIETGDTLSRPSDTLLKSICGTPMYTAPEVLRGEGYENSVDWWSVGVVMFEMLYGGIPFCPPPKYRGDVATFVKVQVTNHALVCPIPYPSPVSSVLSPESVNFMQSMVCEPQQRLKNATSIIQHPWFADIQWHAVHRMRSPLREDTEQYAQKHFAHLASPSSTVPAAAVSASAAVACVNGKQYGPASGNPIRRLKLAAPAGRQEELPTGARVAPAAAAAGAAANRFGGRPAEAASGCTSGCSYTITEHDLFFSRYAFSRKAVDTVPTFSKVLHRTAERYPILPPPCCITTTFSTSSRDPNNNTISTSTPPVSDSLPSFNCTSSGFCPSHSSCECSPAPSTSSSSCCGADCCVRLSKRSPPPLRETDHLAPAISEDTTLPASGEAATAVPGVTQDKVARTHISGTGEAAGVLPPVRTLGPTNPTGVNVTYARDLPGAEAAAMPASAAATRTQAMLEDHEMRVHASRASAMTGMAVTSVAVDENEEGEAHCVRGLKMNSDKHTSTEVERGGQEAQMTAESQASQTQYKALCKIFEQTRGFSEFPGAELHAEATPDQHTHIEIKAVGARKNCRREVTSCLPSPAPSTRASCGSPQAAHSSTQKSSQIKQALEKHLLLQQHEPMQEKLLRQDGQTSEKQNVSPNDVACEHYGLVNQEQAGEPLTLLPNKAPDIQAEVQNRCLQSPRFATLFSGQQGNPSFLRNEQQQLLQQKHQHLPLKDSHRLKNIHELQFNCQQHLASPCEDMPQTAPQMRGEGRCWLEQSGSLPLPSDDPVQQSKRLQQECPIGSRAFEPAGLQVPPALIDSTPPLTENAAGTLLLGLFTTPTSRTAARNLQNTSDACFGATATTRVKEAHKHSKEMGFPQVIASSDAAMCPAAGNEARAC